MDSIWCDCILRTFTGHIYTTLVIKHKGEEAKKMAKRGPSKFQ